MFRGLAGFGAHSRLHVARLADLVPDLPVVVEWIDTSEQVDRLLPRISDLVRSGTITMDDVSIVKHTHRLNERRITRGEEPIVWKYFQYLTLLFTEIYLDRYFRDSQALLRAPLRRRLRWSSVCAREPSCAWEPSRSAGYALSCG